MELVAPDIVAEVKTLSIGLCAAGLAVGLALWLLGWWSHRFWVVLSITLLAGYAGLGLAESLCHCDAVAFSDRHVVLLNWLCGATALLGLAVQFYLTRGRGKKVTVYGKGKKGILTAELVGGSWLPRLPRL